MLIETTTDYFKLILMKKTLWIKFDFMYSLI